MKKLNYIITAGITVFIAACGGNESPKQVNKREDALNQIKKIEAKMHQSMEINNLVADSAMSAYAAFVKEFPEDTLSADFLFKSAEIASAVKKYPEAYADYQLIEKNYPGYKLIEESIYLQAYVLDNFMDQDGKAKMVYERLIERYPNGRFAKDAQYAIENLGKSDEELIKEFKKKNGEN